MKYGRRTHNLGANPSGAVIFFVDDNGNFSLQSAGGLVSTTLSAEQIRLIADLAQGSQGLRR